MAKKVAICGVDTNALPKLKNSEIEELLKKVKMGDELAREQFIVANLRLVLSVVQRFQNKKEKGDDMFQVGCVGLLKAIDNFDMSLNLKFSTYAVPMIIGEIRRYLRDNNSIRVSRSLRDIAYRAMSARERLESKSTNEVCLEEIAAEICVPYSEVVSALDAISDPISIYESVYSDGEEGMLVVDQISDPETEEDKMNKLTLKEGIDRLPERERDVIKMRYFQGKTQTEISQELNMSQAQVSRLENSAIKQLRASF